MNWFEKIVWALSDKMETPQNYGWFHLMWIGIILVTTIVVCIFLKNVNSKKFRIILLIIWITLVLLELYKEIIFSFSYDPSTGDKSWGYQWYIFPFQFCATPLYVLPLAIFLKDGKIRTGAISYLGIYSLIAGIATYAYPGGVFTIFTGINIQTMFYHGLMIVLGCFILTYYRNRLTIKFWASGIPVFVVLATIAEIMNLTLPNILNYHAFNMFFIGPESTPGMPVFDQLWAILPYPLFLMAYLVLFTLLSFIVFMIAKVIIKLSTRKRHS